MLNIATQRWLLTGYPPVHAIGVRLGLWGTYFAWLLLLRRRLQWSSPLECLGMSTRLQWSSPLERLGRWIRLLGLLLRPDMSTTFERPDAPPSKTGDPM